MLSTYQRAKAELTEGKSPDELNFVIVATRSENPDHADVVGKVWDRKAGAWVDFDPCNKNVIIPGRPRLSFRSRDISHWRWNYGPTGSKASMDAMHSIKGVWVSDRTITEFKGERP